MIGQLKRMGALVATLSIAVGYGTMIYVVLLWVGACDGAAGACGAVLGLVVGIFGVCALVDSIWWWRQGQRN